MLQIQSSRDFLQIIFRYRRAAIASIVAVVIIISAGMMIKSPSFSSEAKLFISLGKDNQALPASVRSPGDVIPATPSRDQLLDEQKILLGDNVVTQVAEKFFAALSEEPIREGTWESIKRELKEMANTAINAVKEGLTAIGLRDPRTATDSLKDQLLRNFEINHDPGSAVIEVSFSWKDPEIARRVLVFWLDAYLEERDSLQGYNERLSFYEGQVETLKQSIKESQFELQQRLVEAGSSDINKKMEAISQNIVDLMNQHNQAESELKSVNAGIKAAQRELARLNKEMISEERSILNPVRLDLTERLNQMIMERESLLAEFRHDSKKIRAMDESIAGMKKMIADESEWIVGEQLTESNPNYMQLEKQIQERVIRADELKTTIGELSGQIAAYRKDLEVLVNQSIYIGLLETDIQKYQDEYKNYKSGMEKAKLEMMLEGNRISNVKVMQAPSFNPVRSSLKPLAAIALTPVLALFAVLVVCYLIAMMDRRIYDQSSIRANSGIRIIDILPIAGIKGGQPYNAAMFRLAAALNHLAGEGSKSIAIVGPGVKSMACLVNPLEETKQGVGAQYRLVDATGLAEPAISFPAIYDADYVVIAIESAKITMPQLKSHLDTLKTTFPEKLLGVVIYNRRYEIPQKLFSRMKG